MDVDAKCCTGAATSQENPWGHFRFSRTPQVLEKEIRASRGDEAGSGSEGCWFVSTWPPGNWRKATWRGSWGTVDPPSSRGSCSILQTPGMWLLRPTPRLSFPGGGTLSSPWPDVTLHCAGGLSVGQVSCLREDAWICSPLCFQSLTPCLEYSRHGVLGGK